MVHRSQAPETPPEAKEWAENTLVGVMFGLILGGSRQYLVDRQAGASTETGLHLDALLIPVLLEPSVACATPTTEDTPIVSATESVPLFPPVKP